MAINTQCPIDVPAPGLGHFGFLPCVYATGSLLLKCLAPMALPCTHTGASVLSTSSKLCSAQSGSSGLRSANESPRWLFRGFFWPSVTRTLEPGAICVRNSIVAPAGISILNIIRPILFEPDPIGNRSTATLDVDGR